MKYTVPGIDDATVIDINKSTPQNIDDDEASMVDSLFQCSATLQPSTITLADRSCGDTYI